MFNTSSIGFKRAFSNELLISFVRVLEIPIKRAEKDQYFESLKRLEVCHEI